MKKMFSEIYNGFIGSLDTSDKPFSARKLTAITVMVCVVSAHIKWMAIGDLTNLENILLIDFGFVSALFGLTTYQAVKKSKDSKENTPE